MIRTTILFSIALTTVPVGCNPAPSAPRPSVEDNPPATESRASPPPPSKPVAGPLVSSETMAQIIAGTRSWDTVIDPSRGLVFMTYHTDPRDDGEGDESGLVARANHLCGEPLATKLDETRDDLKARTQDREDPSKALFHCERQHCEHTFRMEWDVQGRYRFDSTPRGPILLEVAEVAGGMAPDFYRQAEIFFDTERRRLATQTCTAP